MSSFSYELWKTLVKFIWKILIKLIRIDASFAIGYLTGLLITVGHIPLEIQHINNKIRACERYGYE